MDNHTQDKQDSSFEGVGGEEEKLSLRERLITIKNRVADTCVKVFLWSLYVLVKGIPIIFLAASIYFVTWYCRTFVESERINAWEWRLYIVIALFLLSILVFGVLRLYNAMVVTSTYLNSLKSELKKYNMELKKWAGDFSKNSQVLSRAFSKLEDVMKILSEIIKGSEDKNKRE